jgi:hypothetical protein
MSDDTSEVDVAAGKVLRTEQWAHAVHGQILAQAQASRSPFSAIINLLYDFEYASGTRLATLLIEYDSPVSRSGELKGVCVLEQVTYEIDARELFEIAVWALHDSCVSWSSSDREQGLRSLLLSAAEAASYFRNPPASAILIFVAGHELEPILDQAGFVQHEHRGPWRLNLPLPPDWAGLPRGDGEVLET